LNIIVASSGIDNAANEIEESRKQTNEIIADKQWRCDEYMMYRSMILVVVTMRKRAQAILFCGAEISSEKEMARGGKCVERTAGSVHEYMSSED
jgi:hypothetical protein